MSSRGSSTRRPEPANAGAQRNAARTEAQVRAERTDHAAGVAETRARMAGRAADAATAAERAAKVEYDRVFEVGTGTNMTPQRAGEIRDTYNAARTRATQARAEAQQLAREASLLRHKAIGAAAAAREPGKPRGRPPSGGH